MHLLYCFPWQPYVHLFISRQWCSGGWAFIFLLSHRLDASWHFLANFLVILDHILLLNFTDGFGGEGLAWDSNNGLQILSKPLLFFSHWILGHVSHLQTLYITNAFSEGEPRHFLIYHYITALRRKQQAGMMSDFIENSSIVRYQSKIVKINFRRH